MFKIRTIKTHDLYIFLVFSLSLSLLLFNDDDCKKEKIIKIVFYILLLHLYLKK